MPFANYCCEQAEATGLTQVCPECAENSLGYQSAMFTPPEPREAAPGPAVAIDGLSEGGIRAAAVVLASNLASLGDSAQKCADSLISMGYDLEELERDNPYNQWMKDIEV